MQHEDTADSYRLSTAGSSSSRKAEILYKQLGKTYLVLEVIQENRISHVPLKQKVMQEELKTLKQAIDNPPLMGRGFLSTNFLSPKRTEISNKSEGLERDLFLLAPTLPTSFHMPMRWMHFLFPISNFSTPLLVELLQRPVTSSDGIATNTWSKLYYGFRVVLKQYFCKLFLRCLEQIM